MKSRSTAVKLLFLSLLTAACAMFFMAIGEGSASALVKRPDPAKMVKNESVYGTNRKTVTVPVAALANVAALAPTAVWTCPYDIVFDSVEFIATTTPSDLPGPAMDAGTEIRLAVNPDGGASNAIDAGRGGIFNGITIATSSYVSGTNPYPAINRFKKVPLASNPRSCKAGDVVTFGILITNGVVDGPAGVLQIDYHLQDVFAYTPDGGAI